MRFRADFCQFSRRSVLCSKILCNIHSLPKKGNQVARNVLETFRTGGPGPYAGTGASCTLLLQEVYFHRTLNVLLLYVQILERFHE